MKMSMSFIRIVLGLTTNIGLELEQLNVKVDFLHGDLDEEIYMVYSKEFEMKEKKVYGL